MLLTEEVTGSLRRLKPTPTVVRDRFKALQKRGVIEPRAKAKKQRTVKQVRRPTTLAFVRG